MSKLSEAEIHEKLPDARGWDRHGDMLVRTWQFPSFRRAIEFVNQVSALIEKTDHYPDIHVSFRNVRVEMSTHDVGGLTERDFAVDLADQYPAHRSIAHGATRFSAMKNPDREVGECKANKRPPIRRLPESTSG